MQRTQRSPFAHKRRLFLEVLEGRQLMAADLQLSASPLVDMAANYAESSASSDVYPDELPPVHILPPIAESVEPAVSGALVGGLSAALAPLSGIPALNSLAGAAASIYLDFNGHFESVWGAYRNITTPVFDQDGDATTFSSTELTTIRNIWAQVSEDYAPFKINVTTVEPASFANGAALRVSIGGN